jgi:superfamily II DNA or RNA helicase
MKSQKLPRPTQIPKLRFLSHKGYAILKDSSDTTEWISYLTQYLTVTPKVNPTAPGASNIRSFPVYRENTTKIYIPRALGFELFGLPTVNTLHQGVDCSEHLIFNGNLRTEQEAPVNAFLKAANDPFRKGGIISLPCGGGKTACALNIACALGKKTLVICHKEFLMNQWKERIQQFIPTARVGLIKAKTVRVKDCDIVLGSLQSISMKEYDSSIFEEFGFICFDEVHHLSAEVFVQAFPKVTSQVFLGLSATLDRKDGLRKVFEWFIGKVVNELVVRTDKALLVKMVKYFDTDSSYGVEKLLWSGQKNTAAMITDICEYEPRIQCIINEYEELLNKEPERKTLILSGRRNHLEMIENALIDRGHTSIGYYVGGMKEADLKKSETRTIILATYSMAAEGMDIPVLNTLILASPIGDIEQSVGRIQRQKPHERKYVPYIIDMWDQYSSFQMQGLRHIKFYKKNGYSFVNTNTNTNTNRNDSVNIGQIDDTSDNENDKADADAKGFDFIDDD